MSSNRHSQPADGAVAPVNQSSPPSPSNVLGFVSGNLERGQAAEAFLEKWVAWLLGALFVTTCFYTVTGTLWLAEPIDIVAAVLFSLVVLIFVVVVILTMRTNVLRELLVQGSSTLFVYFFWAAAIGSQSIATYHITNVENVLYVWVFGIQATVVAVTYCCIPLVDALPFRTGKIICRTATLSTVLNECAALAFRLIDDVAFHNDRALLRWTQKDRYGVEHVIISSFDIQNSLSIVIILQLLEIAYNSFRKPDTASICTDAMLFRNLDQHGAAADVGSLGTVIFGIARGLQVDNFCTRIYRWLTLVLVVVNVFEIVLIRAILGFGVVSGILHIFAGVINLAFTMSIIPCFRVHTLKKLLRVPEVLYYIGAAFACRAGTIGLYGSIEFQSWSLPVHQLGLLSIITLLPLLDALPPHMRQFLVRGACPVAALVHGQTYIRLKMNPAQIYNEVDVPEIGAPGITTLSLFELKVKSEGLLAMIAALLVYRAWRHPGEAGMLHLAPRLVDLHARHLGLARIHPLDSH